MPLFRNILSARVRIRVTAIALLLSFTLLTWVVPTPSAVICTSVPLAALTEGEAVPVAEAGDPSAELFIPGGQGGSLRLKAAFETLCVDWGDGRPIRYAPDEKAAVTEIVGSPKGERVTLYGGNLTSLSCREGGLSALDVSRAVTLRELDCSRNALTELDVSRNEELRELNCEHNRLTELNLSQNRKLLGLVCNRNRLTSLSLENNGQLQWLRCSHNRLQTLDLQHNTNLRELFCAGNRLTGLDVSALRRLTDLECSGNRLSGLDLKKNAALLNLRCAGNCFTLAALGEIRSTLSMDCAPQRELPLPAGIRKGETVDLSAQSSVRGTASVFTWYDAEDHPVEPASARNGVFTFGDALNGKAVYAVITNERIPALALRTTQTRIGGADKTNASDSPSPAEPALGAAVHLTGVQGSAAVSASVTSEAADAPDGNCLTFVRQPVRGAVNAALVVGTEPDPIAELRREADEAAGRVAPETNVRYLYLTLTAARPEDTDDGSPDLLTAADRYASLLEVCIRYPDGFAENAGRYTWTLRRVYYGDEGEEVREDVPLTCRQDGIVFRVDRPCRYVLAWSEKKTAGRIYLIAGAAALAAILLLSGLVLVSRRRRRKAHQTPSRQKNNLDS